MQICLEDIIKLCSHLISLKKVMSLKSTIYIQVLKESSLFSHETFENDHSEFMVVNVVKRSFTINV